MADSHETSRSVSSRDSSPVTVRHASSTSISSIPTLRKQPSATFAPSESPRSSRNPSPVRSAMRQHGTPPASSVQGRAGLLRSRQSSHDTSPHRTPALSTPTSAPSAAAIQRALSAASIPQLQQTQQSQSPNSVTDAVTRLTAQKRPIATASGESTPTFAPPSPRLKSPPPVSVRSRRNSALVQNQKPAPPSIVVEPSSTPSEHSVLNDALREEPIQLQPPPGPKAPSRGPSGPRPVLETVVENIAPNGSTSSKGTKAQSDEDGPSTIRAKAKDNNNGEASSKLAESESDANMSDGRGRRTSQSSTIRPKNVAAIKAVYPGLGSKSRASEGTRNMTVETETVSSIPQSQIATIDRSTLGRPDLGGSLRMKPSTETIRPRKERKRATRKAPSINNGTASSKADIFEARVASAVDEANSSDSDETFVYESNPPEPQHRVSRHHSRTPSGTSLHSQSDFRHGMRPYGDHRIAGKRSMKFSNNPYSVLDSPEAMGDGTVRAHHARHIGRFGRPGGSSRTSLYDQDSPFTQASKLRSTTLSVSERAPSRPGTPRSTQSAQHRPSGLFGKRNDNSQYDFEGEGADDERTPMLGSVRTPRSQRTYGRRYNSDNSMRSIDYYGVREPRSRFSRVGGLVLGLLVVMMVTMGAVGLLVMFNKPLTNFHVDKIQNVLASEQEIMLDLLVGAVNPNILSVTVTDMDVNIFAKSKYVNPIGRDDGTVLATAQRRRLVAKGEAGGTPWQDEHGHWHAGSGVDQGTDPIEGDSQTMLLGRILHFDQALCFEGSPLKRHTHYSLGELRLGHPGNKTESGGSERWERVLQYPFELILRGVLRYQLPMSNRHQTAAIGASVIVHPEDPIDSHGRMRLESVDDSEDWQWIEGDYLDGVEGFMAELH
ncbi:hypothetical protein AUEXF2481DRAFT_35550 [Aureobasidium subglaciale EXF-2481]|uniref:Vacuolar segregation subunit 7 n=1 Tax=Aureobasidium subglaciale (strain EXF-2481) TaxID=1043005 RepID=A0A074YU17_AURSE|nr:uncharacterized protein AUEXF2481DRAFT_35550 [Aureobasidium subglaciale EXF-2481]KEQ99634.1 hypothetical protein AUEXF2481DRAFT_35550 [Aureobasidium subglaciale EXF-2481]